GRSRDTAEERGLLEERRGVEERGHGLVERGRNHRHRDSGGQGGIQEGRTVDSLEGDEAEGLTSRHGRPSPNILRFHLSAMLAQSKPDSQKIESSFCNNRHGG